jgi:hypothetical protein
LEYARRKPIAEVQARKTGSASGTDGAGLGKIHGGPNVDAYGCGVALGALAGAAASVGKAHTTAKQKIGMNRIVHLFNTGWWRVASGNGQIRGIDKWI